MARKKKNILEELEALENEECRKEETDDFSDFEIDEAKEKDDEVADDTDAEDMGADVEDMGDDVEGGDEDLGDLVDDLDDEVGELKDVNVEKDDMKDFKDKLNQILDSLSDLKDAISGDELSDEPVDEGEDMGAEDMGEDEGDEDTSVSTSDGEEEDLYKKEDFTPLFSKQQSLTEEFKEKANTVFNAVLQEKVLMVAEKIATKANRMVDKKVKKLVGTIVEDVNEYFDYIVEEWMTENEIAIEQGIRTNLVENVLFKFKKALAESYIELPEEDLVIMEELEKKTSDLQTRLDGVMSENIKLRKHLVESKKREILGSLTEGLTTSEADRLKSLSKNVEFESIEQYKTSVKALKESVVKPVAGKTESKTEKKELNEEVGKTEKPADKTSYIDISNIDPTKMFTDVEVVRSPKIDDYVSHLNRSIRA